MAVNNLLIRPYLLGGGGSFGGGGYLKNPTILSDSFKAPAISLVKKISRKTSQDVNLKGPGRVCCGGQGDFSGLVKTLMHWDNHKMCLDD